jgi:pantoate--beta-alanine ligase
MIIFKTKNELQEYLHVQRSQNKKIGFVPTMGALHDGHISLIINAKKDEMLTVCSIFVNPAQFNDKDDFDKYPSTLGADIALLDMAGCAILYLPSVNEIYPNGVENAISYGFGKLETVLEGAKRLGHFNGVGKVVGILLETIMPDALYMGNKDYQQCLIVKDLCRQMNLSERIRFVFCPTSREADGLAMSSRNRRLTEPQRAIAGIIYQCLISIQSKYSSGGNFAIVQKECLDLLRAKGFEVDYISLSDANTLEELAQYDPNKKMIALIAAKIGNVRLIDNMMVNE